MTKSMWNEMYILAKNYYNYHHNLEIPRKFQTKDGYTYDENGKKLGIWICNQRMLYKNKKLETQKIIKLNDIEMIWKIKQTWEDMYNLAMIYYKYNNNIKIPKNFKTKDGYTYDEKGLALGLWINKQRTYYKNNKLTQNQIKKLNEIGMIWNLNEYIWKKMYNLASIYYIHNKNLKIPKTFKTKNGYTYDKKGEKLGIWIRTQRNNQKENKLTIKQIYLLNDIGMVWNASINYEEKWNQMYNLAKKYYYYNKSLDIPENFQTKDGITYNKNGEKLGIWIQKQRNAYKLRQTEKSENGIKPLSDERKIMLENIGMIWNVNDLNWYKNYLIAQKYYKKNGNINVPVHFKTKDGISYDESGIDLYNWINYQIATYNLENKRRKSQLTKKQIKALENIGISWNKTNIYLKRWLYMYKLAYIYYKTHNNLDIKSDFKTINGIDYDENGETLGRWIRKQRENYKERKRNDKNQITETQIELLNYIGMIWVKLKRKSKYSMLDINKENLQEEEKYRELIAKIRFLKLNNLPLTINDKPNPIFFMKESELIEYYNINLNELLSKYYSQVQSDVVMKKIKK